MAKKRKNKDGLTDREERFCQEYIVDLNGTQAAIRAGYTENENSAAVIASRLLSKVKIQARVAELKKKQSDRTAITADKILQELLKLATVDQAGAYKEDGSLKKIHEIPEEIRRAIAGVEVLEEFDGHGQDRTYIGDTKKVKFFDKIRALELLGKHLKLFTEKVEHKHTHTLEDLVAGSKSEDEKPKGEK